MQSHLSSNKFSMPTLLNTVLAAFLLFINSSCRENPEKIIIREKQKIELAKLKGEIAIMEEKIKNLPPDSTDDLARTRKELIATNNEITQLQQEINQLEATKKALQEDFDKYRLKYQVK